MLPDVHYQSATYRLKGGIEIYGVGKQMVDVIMATLAAQIEWYESSLILIHC